MLVAVLVLRRRSRWKICGAYLRTYWDQLGSWVFGCLDSSATQAEFPPKPAKQSTEVLSKQMFCTNASNGFRLLQPFCCLIQDSFWRSHHLLIHIWYVRVLLHAKDDIGMVGAARSFQQSHKSSGKQVRRRDDLPSFAKTVGGVFTVKPLYGPLWVKVLRAAWALLRMIGWRPEAENLPGYRGQVAPLCFSENVEM